MNFFEIQGEEYKKANAPLAQRMRPQNIDEFVGQEHILGKGKMLYRAILADKLSNIIFYGPPGSGKTTISKVIANMTKAEFYELNASTSGVKDIKDIISKAMENLFSNKKSIVFIDEIHRFNKLQQDTLLPYMENGTIILIGATTENPYFEVNKALLSRANIFKLEMLTQSQIISVIDSAISDEVRGVGKFDKTITDDAKKFIADSSNGDARRALNALELAFLTSEEQEIDISIVEECIQKKNIIYDKNGDEHYNIISAFIKSMRGSDPNAALYYLARMIEAGEDIRFIARRMVICASEDVGNADPHALLVAMAAAQAVDFIGLPECAINLSQAVVYISCAPKSNASYLAINEAFEDVKNVSIKTIPDHLKDYHSISMKKDIKYKYPHFYPGSYVPQQYLPDELLDRTYYRPTENGVEKKIKESMEIKAEVKTEIK